MDAVTLVVDPIQIAGAALAVLCVGVLVGAAVGYLTAATDLDKERAKARRVGFDRGIEAAWTAMPLRARDVVRQELHALEIRADDEQAPVRAERSPK